MDQDTEALRLHFLGWQCRVRQLAVRRHEGRPTSGMCPKAQVSGVPEGSVTTLLVKGDAAPFVTRFRYMYLRTQDPAERRSAALDFLADAYYQRPREFSDRLTALFAAGSDLAERMCAAGDCLLSFSQFSQSYVIPCAVAELPAKAPAFEFTVGHNRLFNPNMPPGVRVLQFTPEWSGARAEPAVC